MDDARAAELRAEVAAHKAAIRRHRVALARAKSLLVALERAPLAERGIRLVLKAKGLTHGREAGTDP